jgi:MFS family permease
MLTLSFFAISLSTSRLAPFFGQPVGTVTLSITLTLLFRPLGALVFGLLSDRYGRQVRRIWIQTHLTRLQKVATHRQLGTHRRLFALHGVLQDVLRVPRGSLFGEATV